MTMIGDGKRSRLTQPQDGRSSRETRPSTDRPALVLAPLDDVKFMQARVRGSPSKISSCIPSQVDLQHAARLTIWVTMELSESLCSPDQKGTLTRWTLTCDFETSISFVSRRQFFAIIRYLVYIVIGRRERHDLQLREIAWRNNLLSQLIRPDSQLGEDNQSISGNGKILQWETTTRRK